MLSPDSRTVAMEVLRPPAGHRIDQAVLTTFSLDLDVLLALPLAVLAQSDRGVEELVQDPLLLLEALREAGERVHVFVDEAGIAIPGTSRALYAMLEKSVHPVRAANGGAFHPKVWIVRFVDGNDTPLIRVAVSSRNLTFDRSWDVALTSEAPPASRRVVRQSRALAELLRAVPGLALRDLPEALEETLGQMADQVARTAFPAPDPFDSPIRFHGLGLSPGARRPWKPDADGRKVLAVAPFVNRTALDALAAVSDGERTLISRREALDDLPDDALSDWDTLLVLSDAAVDEPEDATAGRPSGLHAKIIALEHGREVSWYVGSANLTAAAFTGQNVEMIASITGRRGNAGSGKGVGTERFRDSGFLSLCEPYHRVPKPAEDPQLVTARRRLDEARRALLESDLKVVCRVDGDSWCWEVQGELPLPETVNATVWPVSIGEEQGREFQGSTSWMLPLSRLTAFVAFRLHVEADVDDIRLALKLPAEGMPEGRVAHVLRTLIDSPERFLQFLRALLGGLEGLADWGVDNGRGAWRGVWGAGLGGETLLEDLVRIAARDPVRLEPVRRLIADLRATPEGREIVPDDLHEIWQVVDAVITERSDSRGKAKA